MEVFAQVSLLQQIMTPCICLCDFFVTGAVIYLVSSSHLRIQEGLNFSISAAFYLFWGQGGDFQTPILWNQKSEVYFSFFFFSKLIYYNENEGTCWGIIEHLSEGVGKDLL